MTRPDPVGSFFSGAGAALTLKDMIASAARKKEIQAREDVIWDFKLKTELSDQAAELINGTRKLTFDNAKLEFEAERESMDYLNRMLSSPTMSPANVDGRDLFLRATGEAARSSAPRVNTPTARARAALLGESPSRGGSPLDSRANPVVPFDDRKDFDESFREGTSGGSAFQSKSTGNSEQ